MSALFDLADYREPVHACAGDTCQVCQNARTPREAKNLGTSRPTRDPRWWEEARQFITQLGSGATFTGYVESTRKSNHGRVVRVWRKA